jgi:hypothetical protein
MLIHVAFPDDGMISAILRLDPEPTAATPTTAAIAAMPRPKLALAPRILRDGGTIRLGIRFLR